jgi:CheY-specific phosphatase CheX
MNHKTTLEMLSKRIIEYIKDDLELRDVAENFTLDEVSAIQYNDISTFISLSGDLTGTIGLSISNSLAKILVTNFIYGEIDENILTDLASENVSETLNITLGNIIKDLEVVKQGGKVDISTPYTLHNSVHITKKKNGTMYVSQIRYLDEIIIVSYFI